jgi:hypothetical protein
MLNLTDSFGPFLKNLHAAYFICAGVILLVLGLPWLWVRCHIPSPNVRRVWSSLILSLAFAPSILGGSEGGFTMPAISLLLMGALGYLVSFDICIFGAATIALIWGLMFIVRSLFGLYLSHRARRLRSDETQPSSPPR